MSMKGAEIMRRKRQKLERMLKGEPEPKEPEFVEYVKRGATKVKNRKLHQMWWGAGSHREYREESTQERNGSRGKGGRIKWRHSKSK